jgi:hypothetical protein
VKKVLLGVVAWLEHLAAFLFLGVVVGVAVIYFSEMVTAEKARDAWAVLSGKRLAVEQGNYDRWQKLEREARAKTKVMTEEERGSGQANEGFRRRQEYWDKQFERETAILGVMNQMVNERQKAFDQRAAAFKTQRDTFEKVQKAVQAAREDANLKRLLQLYQGMEPELIAQDFLTKWNDPKEKDEVVELLRRMPARLSAEVINSIADSKLRVEIMKKIRKS